MADDVTTEHGLLPDQAVDRIVQTLCDQKLKLTCDVCYGLVTKQLKRKKRKEGAIPVITNRISTAHDRISAQNDWSRLKRLPVVDANRNLIDFISAVSEFVEAVTRFVNTVGQTRKNVIHTSWRSLLELKDIKLKVQQIELGLGEVSLQYVMLGIFIPKPLKHTSSSGSGIDKQFPVDSFCVGSQQSNSGSGAIDYAKRQRYGRQRFDYRERHERYRSQRVEGTCEWIFQDDSYQQWLNASNSTTLLCIGASGTGKSVLSSKIIEELSKAQATNVAYFYMAPAKEQTASDVAASILWQLSNEDDSRINALAVTSDFNDKRILKSPPLSRLLEQLRGIHQRETGQTYIIIDALDDQNMSSADEFHHLIRDLSHLGWKFYITSREASECFHDINSGLVIEMSKGKIIDDILRVVKAGLADYLQNHSYSSLLIDLEADIVRHIEQASDGKYITAALHLDSILQQYTVSGIRQALANINSHNPILTALNNVRRLPHEERVLVQNALVWATDLVLPLKMGGLCEALGLAAADKEQDLRSPKNLEVIPIQEKILGFCGGLINRDPSTMTVSVVHEATRAYILENWPQPQEPISLVSIKYLLMPDFDNHRQLTVSEDDLLRLLLEYQFLEYASNCWFMAGNCVTEDSRPDSKLFFPRDPTAKLATELICQLLQRRSSLELALLVFFWRRNTTKARPLSWLQLREKVSAMSSLHVTAHFGLSRAILKSSPASTIESLSMLDWSGKTPLHIAVRRGHLEIVEALAAEMKETNIPDRLGLRPVNYAFNKMNAKTKTDNPKRRENYTKILRCLLENQVDCFTNEKYGLRPHVFWKLIFLNDVSQRSEIIDYYIKSSQCYSETLTSEKIFGRAVQYKDTATALVLLFEKWVNPTLVGNVAGRPALHEVISHGSTSIHVVRAMLAMGWDASEIDIHHSPRSSALQCAIHHRNTLAVEELLKRGAQTEYNDDKASRALSLAVQARDMTSIQLLLKYGADPNHSGLLHSMVQAGQIKIARLLVSYGAKPDKETLECAVERANVEMTRFLLEANIGANHSDLLLSTIRKGQIEMTESLLRLGTIPDSKLLEFTVRKSNVKLTRLLLEHGAPLELNDSRHPTVLFVALEGDTEMMERLLRRPVDINRTDKDGCTVLLRAVRQRKRSMVNLLLQSGADITTTNLEGHGILHAALESQDPEIAQLVVLCLLGSKQGIAELRRYDASSFTDQSMRDAFVRYSKLWTSVQ